MGRPPPIVHIDQAFLLECALVLAGRTWAVAPGREHEAMRIGFFEPGLGPEFFYRGCRWRGSIAQRATGILSMYVTSHFID